VEPLLEQHAPVHVIATKQWNTHACLACRVRLCSEHAGNKSNKRSEKGSVQYHQSSTVCEIAAGFTTRSAVAGVYVFLSTRRLQVKLQGRPTNTSAATPLHCCCCGICFGLCQGLLLNT
jgi:hypothetical protein